MDFYFITSWVYPLIDLTIMILCFSLLRGSGGVQMGLGFLIMSVSSLSWPVMDIIISNTGASENFLYNDMGSYVAFFAYFVASTLIIVGIINLGIDLRKSAVNAQLSVPTTGNNPYVSPGANVEHNVSAFSGGFGNLLLYILPVITGMVLIVVGFIVLINSYRSDSGFIFIMLGAVVIMGASIYLLYIIYQLWSFIISESNKLGLTSSIKTPGQAVGYMFIPFYNFYWMFKVYGKMAIDVNAIARQRGATQLMPEGLGSVIPVLAVLTIIPYLGSLIALILYLILMPIFISRAMRMCQSLAGAGQSD